MFKSKGTYFKYWVAWRVMGWWRNWGDKNIN